MDRRKSCDDWENSNILSQESCRKQPNTYLVELRCRKVPPLNVNLTRTDNAEC
jgi:hypothetical protein